MKALTFSVSIPQWLALKALGPLNKRPTSLRWSPIGLPSMILRK
jgi:hypothetical protein